MGIIKRKLVQMGRHGGEGYFGGRQRKMEVGNTFNNL